VTSRERLDHRLIPLAYAEGIFPMSDADGSLGWYTADPRGILEHDKLRISRSLRSTLRRGLYEVRVDTAFREVMLGCAERDETWISDALLEAYSALHEEGVAHSVEAWKEGRLVGGLYGVALGGAFMGESMFARTSDASKVCLVALVERLRTRGYVLHDMQMLTPHTERMGGTEISARNYRRRLAAALPLQCTFQ
jgi:leucyl/phenylalanyl-tRNA--protein transferase